MNSLDEVRNALADNNVMITAYIEQLENEVGELRGSTTHLENKIKEGKLAYEVLNAANAKSKLYISQLEDWIHISQLEDWKKELDLWKLCVQSEHGIDQMEMIEAQVKAELEFED